MLSKFSQRFFIGFLIVTASANAALAQQPDKTSTSTQVASFDDESDLTDQAESPDEEADPSNAAEEEISEAKPQYWATRTMEMRFGLAFSAGDNYCTALHATLPFPMTWPEQEVELIGFDMPEFARYKLRPQKQGAGEIVIDMDQMAPNDTFDVIGKVRIKKSFIKPPEDPSLLQFAKSPQRKKELQLYLNESPYIESKHRLVRDIAIKIREEEHESAWNHVEAIYDYVRETIQYMPGEIRTSTEALRDGTGDCEEMTSVFIAICRASNIPARCVWVPDHCYPEFYLEDEKGNGYWFPCQVAGDRQFGQMNEYRPILQKGDRFKTPESKKEVRYLAETFNCKYRPTGKVPPSIRQIQDLGPLQEEIKNLQDGAEQKAAAAE